MVEFVKVNNNFKNKKTGDCVIRALSNASGKTYKEVAQELFDLWMKYGYMINDKHTYEKWLEQNDFVKYKQPKRVNGTKYLVGEIIDVAECRLDDDSIVISMANHLTSVVEGSLVDIWDCRHKTIGNYWIKRN